MLNKIKSFLLPLVKPLLLEHLKDLSLLDPMLSKVLQDKSHMSKEQADSLSKDLTSVIQTELALLINKI